MLRRWSLVLVLALVAAGCTVTTSVSTGSMTVEDFQFLGADGATRNGAEFQPGEKVLTKFKVKGVKKDDASQVWVQEDLKVTAPDGSVMLDEKNLLDLKQKVEQGDPEVTADNTISLPDKAPPGDYKVQMNLRDQVGKGTTTFNSTFHLKGEPGAAGGTPSSGEGGKLQLSQVRFAEAQEGPERAGATYKATEKVWVLFNVTGFEQKEDGGVWIQEDIKVLDPDGDAILDEKNLLDFKDKLDPGLEAIPAHNQITLPQGAGAGQYTVHLEVRDALSNTSTEHETTFTVE